MQDVAQSKQEQTVYAHIKELRNHFLVIVPFFLISSGVAYLYREQIITVLMSPLAGKHLTYLTPGGGFSFIFSVMFWCGLAVTMPFLLMQLYRFVMPALPRRAQKKTIRILISSIALFIAGAVFGYLCALPGALRFLMGFADSVITATLTADSYLNFVLVYTIGFGVLFQLPLLLVIFNWIKPLSLRKLLSFERYLIVGSFIVAGIITPTPDVINQTIMALPIIVMYQLGFCCIALGRVMHRYHHTERMVVDNRQERQLRPVAVAEMQPTSRVIDDVIPAAVVSRGVNIPPARSRTIQIPLRQSVDGISTSIRA